MPQLTIGLYAHYLKTLYLEKISEKPDPFRMDSAKAQHQKYDVLIIGAGPAGLTAGYLASKEKLKTLVLESDTRYVGGISRTVNYKGFLCDIGGHRFFSKSQEVEDFWSEILPNDLLTRPRSSRIFYRGQYFSYPLKAFEALFRLGVVESTLCVLSYIKSRLLPVKDPKHFEDWVSNQFGKRLFGIFFKTYTEKVWGMDCKDISSDWAAQRIKGLSLFSAIWNALKPRGFSKNKIKSLIESFRYPRLGPGMMWDHCASKMTAQGGELLMGQKVVELEFSKITKLWTVTWQDTEGKTHTAQSRHVISSAPIRDLMTFIAPAPSKAVQAAAASLKYRDFLIVMLIMKDKKLFQDNWLYIHEPSVSVGRIQNFKSWSPQMVPDSQFCSFGMEYFCNEKDPFWSMTDGALITQAKTEFAKLGLGPEADVLDATVIRQTKAYPVYDGQYVKNVNVIKQLIKEHYPGLHLVGRNGMHKYNNQDHSMMTAMLCVKNILAGKEVFDLWAVNQDAEYHESSSTSGERLVPSAISPDKTKSSKAIGF
jgi:protoporphyrinogen oxidase